MKLRTGSPTYSDRTSEPLQEKVVFNAVALEPMQDEVSEVTVDTLPKLEPVKRELPVLQAVKRATKTVELKPLQPVAAVEAPAPVSEEAKVESSTAVWGGNPYEANNEPTNSSEDVAAGREESNDQLPRLQLRESDANNESQNVTKIESDNEGGPPPLERIEQGNVVVEQAAMPKLQLTKGSAEPAPLTDIPKLDAYNKMEVVHLLIGRSVEDEEVVLLQSFPERFVRSKQPDEFQQSLFDRINRHVANLVESRTYDFAERRNQRKIEVAVLSPHQTLRGTEWAASYIDTGSPLASDIRRYADEQEISVELAAKEMKDQGEYRDPHVVFTWALVKVKIGHDFGAYKLSELMPVL
jgi:hypothetical protein